MFHLVIYGCTGSSLLHEAFSSCSRQGPLSRCGGRLLIVGSRARGLIVVACRLSCPLARRNFLEPGSNPCPLHWQQILHHWATREVLSDFLKMC